MRPQGGQRRPEKRGQAQSGQKPHSHGYPPRRAEMQPSARDFLPTSREEMAQRGWDSLDVLLVSGDAYIDHPAFGVPLLGRLLEAAGWRVGIISQPDWKSPADISRLGRPRLFCGISAGCLDSMLAHYTAFRKKRSDDAYSPGGGAGLRPNRATIVYTSLARQAFPGVPVILGGIEASLRRAAHFDFWSDSLRRSLLFDAKADLILYGMAERAILAAADRLDQGKALAGIPGSAWIASQPTPPDYPNISALDAQPASPAGMIAGNACPIASADASTFFGNKAGLPEVKALPSFEEIQAEPRKLVAATLDMEAQLRSGKHCLSQAHGAKHVLMAPPAAPLSQAEMDALYELPFAHAPHPAYRERIPAWDMVNASITATRGCGGGCAFCSLALHQGRRIVSRSAESIKQNAEKLAKSSSWHGSLSDVGGPTANAWGSFCAADPAACARSSCYAPMPCPSLRLRQKEYLELLRELKRLPGISHVRIASGIRHDLALLDLDFLDSMVAEFTGGQLKVAPEHSSEKVLSLMRKPSFKIFESFAECFARACGKAGKEQYLIPYLVSAFPGCTMEDMAELSRWFKARGWRPKQVQCFIPTPGTVATAMYYSATDADGNPIHVARTDRERLGQHYLLMGGEDCGPED